LRLVEAREAHDAARLTAFQQAAAVGFIDLDEGRYRAIAGDKIDALITMRRRRTAPASGG
jgi:antitoxin ParD1/3/4